MRKDRGWDNLPTFSREMYKERYFGPQEDYNSWLDRMANYADDDEMFLRIKTYIHNYHFHPSTPVSSFGGLPISCYVNEVEDSKQGIFSKFSENNHLGSHGGGIGTSWSAVRELGAKVGDSGASGGIIPFIKVSDSSTLAVSQGGLRRASQAVYLDVSHPEIEEFIDVRRPTGDANRRSLNVHHGVVISDSFMDAVELRTTWNLVSPKDSSVVKTVDAFDLFQKMLVTRMETGEPYMLFKDTVNAMAPEEYKAEGMEISMSNLCSEITLHTAPDYTGVCCLGSINLEYYDEFKDIMEQFIYDCTRFLDNVLQEFVDKTDGLEGFTGARNSAINESSLGLGVMGFASLLQKKMIPWESPMARGLNQEVFSRFKACTEKANFKACLNFGQSPLAEKTGDYKHNTHMSSIAPTASISTLCNGTSQGVDPRLGNSYVHKTNIGTYTQRNKYLEAILLEYCDEFLLGSDWIEDQWKSITKHEGSVQHLDFLTGYEKDVFKTAIEINQGVIIDLASDRAPYIDQAQSINLFLRSDEHVENVYNFHVRAWKQKLKSLYYCRSTAASRASSGSQERQVITEVDECLSCQ